MKCQNIALEPNIIVEVKVVNCLESNIWWKQGNLNHFLGVLKKGFGIASIAWSNAYVVTIQKYSLLDFANQGCSN